MKRTGIVALGIFLTLAVALPAAAGADPPIGTRPELVVRTLDGKTFDLATERGKWVIVNFWATWCAPCIAEMPDISQFVAARPDVTAIGLAWDRSPRDKLLEFARRHPVDYPLARVDMDHPPSGFPAPLGLPTTWLVAPDGRIAKHFIGPVNAKLLEAAIKAPAPTSGASGP